MLQQVHPENDLTEGVLLRKDTAVMEGSLVLEEMTITVSVFIVCVVLVLCKYVLPDFLVGSCSPHEQNWEKRYKLYKKFWQLLKQLCLWEYPLYKRRKCEVTANDDPQEILPKCIVDVRHSTRIYTCIYMYYVLNIIIYKEVRRQYPNPEGLNYTDYIPSCIIDND